MRLELAERRRDGAGGKLAKLVAADAADVFDLLEPVGLREFFRDGALAAKLAHRRDLEHRVPIDGGVVLRRRRVVRSSHRGEIENIAGLAIDLGGIDEAIA